ncbi:TauD/TfdA family dioxygenase [Vineibacter terrae]|uniref:TauD/TfdA family dioxygenase n=1 Tax=Vineibacter terrae TaxID=2586908 RepID=A0A5C8PG32_9HYPH|nr:TauD/TfdA family dioxygenase [Vineibacter terrae]TXL72131.1 TauD/TfdA family dioxygenase [Vineibacter terrae]
MESQEVSITSLSPALGAEVHGLDLAEPLTGAQTDEIASAYRQHHLLAFRDQKLSKAAQIAFSRRFGEFELPVNKDYLGIDYPELHVVNNLGPSGRPQSLEDIENKGNYFWHTDASYMKRPSSTTLLYAVRLPRSGGDTMFANLAAAYQTLSDAMKAHIEALRVVHSWEQSRINSNSRPATEEEKRKAPPVVHPLVRTHPETGERALYLGNHTSHVAGMPIEDGCKLLAELLGPVFKPRSR